MDQETRAAIDTLHGRVSDLKERIVNLEAQQPHVNAALDRIETSVKTLNGHLSKAVWIILGSFLLAVWKIAAAASSNLF